MRKYTEFVESPEFVENIKFRIPVLIAEGARPGPTVLFAAGQHGRELNGVAALQVFYAALDPAKLAGRVIVLPMLNPAALRMRQQDFPSEIVRYNPAFSEFNTHNMNRKWNGEPFATAPGAIAGAVYERYVRAADAVLDIHGWRSGSTAFGETGTRDAMLALGLRWNLDRPSEAPPTCLSRRARCDGKIGLLIELSGQTRVFPDGVRQGVRAANNLLKFMRALDGEPELPARQFIQKRDQFVKAPEAGLVIPFFEDQTIVPAGAEYLRIVSPDTGAALWSCRPAREMFNVYSGRFYFAEGREPTSAVEPGMLIGHLAEFESKTNGKDVC